jgi:hypothetical protein
MYEITGKAGIGNRYQIVLNKNYRKPLNVGKENFIKICKLDSNAKVEAYIEKLMKIGQERKDCIYIPDKKS